LPWKRRKPFKLIIGSTQSPRTIKIANENENENENENNFERSENDKENFTKEESNIERNSSNFIGTVQKRKTSTRKLNNKSIVKPSLLSEPKTKLVKQQKKVIKDARRRKLSNSEENEPNTSDDIVMEVNEEENSNENEINGASYIESNNEKESEKPKTIKKRKMTNIQMLNENEKFSITEEANNLFPKISLSQLLSASPSIRKELEQGCKPRVEKILCSLTNTSLPIICGEIDNKTFKILYYTSANVNVITNNCLGKLKHKVIKQCENLEDITIVNGTKVTTNSYIELK